jgi:PAS domain-containing protein
VSHPSREWLDAIPGAVTVCDPRGVVVEMNEAAARGFAKDGGRGLIGRSLLDCHPEPARGKVARLLETRRPNVYTIEKNGARRLVYQAPWLRAGEFAGLIEIVLDLPADVPHFVREAS